MAVAIATGLAGCGSDKEGKQLPASSVAQLDAQLSSIRARIDNGSVGACDDIAGGDQPNTTEVQRVIDSLPNDTDSDLRNAVQDSFDHLFDLVQDTCRSLRDQTNTETTPTETTPTETTPTETTETNTTPTETTETNTTPTTPTTTTPDDNGNGNGNGNSGNGNSGNGNGNGGGAAGPSGGGE